MKILLSASALLCFASLSLIFCDPQNPNSVNDNNNNTNQTRFVTNNDNTISDNQSGLTWYASGSESSMDWTAAASYCSSLGSGWRLPTMEELKTLVDAWKASNGPLIPLGSYLHSQGFSNLQTTPNKSYYWSSKAEDATYAWLVCFASGSNVMRAKTSAHYVIAVK